ncbi:MAG: hypothetical protein K2K75_01585 [Muribaculaceae bacterium]|nr:hypothetical protein [Muribaculaceae bacterium]
MHRNRNQAACVYTDIDILAKDSDGRLHHLGNSGNWWSILCSDSRLKVMGRLFSLKHMTYLRPVLQNPETL